MSSNFSRYALEIAIGHYFSPNNLVYHDRVYVHLLWQRDLVFSEKTVSTDNRNYGNGATTIFIVEEDTFQPSLFVAKGANINFGLLKEFPRKNYFLPSRYLSCNRPIELGRDLLIALCNWKKTASFIEHPPRVNRIQL